MAQVLQLRRGTTAQNDIFTGAIAEVSVDTDRKSLRVHDGSAMGGREIADLETAVPLLSLASSVVAADEIPVIQSGVAKRATKTQILDGIVDANIAATADISGTKLADDAITAVKIASGAVTETKIASGAVTETKIADSAITSAKIANGTIVDTDISASAAIAASKLASVLDLSGNTVTLPDGNIATAKIADGAVTAPKVASGMIVQVVSAEYATYATVTGAIPADDTIPQNNEGTQLLTLSITPSSSASKIVLYGQVYGSTNATAQALAIALFRDSVVDAIFATNDGIAASTFTTMPFVYADSPSTSSAVTYSLRLGVPATFYVNGSSTTRRFGGTAKTVLVAMEIR